MPSANPAATAAASGNSIPLAKSPIDVARETLRTLSIRKLAPTPDNYRRFYEEISGTRTEDSGDSPEPLLAVLRELPRASAALHDPSLRLERALTARNWKAFGAEIAALAEAAATPAAADDETQGTIGWPETIRELLRQHELRHAAVSPRQKQEGLERVLGAFGRSPQLKDKLHALVRSWGSARASGAGIDVARAQPEPAVPAGDGHAQAPVAGPSAAPPAAPSETAAVPAASATLRRLLAEVLRHDVAPRFSVEPALGAMVAELADFAAQADSAAACADLAQRLESFWARAKAVRNQDDRLVLDLMALVRLLVENIGELVDDDQWIGGQVEVMRQLMAQPLTPRLLDDAQERFRAIIARQSTLKHSLADARSTLKDMIAVFVERLGELSQSTADYHERIGVYAAKIEQTEDVGSLREVLDGLMGDIRTMQLDAQRSREEVSAAREQAQAAECKIRQLESELEEISEKVREDALTGSLNRRGLDEALTRETARAERYGNSLCVTVIDLDNFKQLNDTHGHLAGDRALVHLVKVVKGMLRPSDSVGRFGGEEFVILLPETTLAAGKLVIERLQRELTKQFFLADNERLLITFSAGVAQWRPGETETAVVQRADHAMYLAKQAGKNRVFIAE